MIVQALNWIGDIDGFLEIIDQRLLPTDFTKLKCTNIEQVFDAIKTLAVRGAPAIGVSAAYGVVVGLQKLQPADNLANALGCVEKS